MRIPTLAACALAVLAAQDWNQQANASQTPVPSHAGTSVSDAASLRTLAVSEQGDAIAPPEVLPESPTLNQTHPAPLVIAAEPESEPGVEIPVVPPPSSTPSVRPDAQPGVRSLTRPQLNQRSGESNDRPLTPEGSNITAQQIQTRYTTSTRVQIEGQELPVPGVLPRDFTFPIRTEVVTDAAIATDTPITDQAYPTFSPRTSVGTLEELARYREARTAAIQVWGEQVRGCLQESPRLVSLKPDGQSILVLFNGNPGRIVRNANGRLVCPG
ncbi:MAG TPA: hypothetical protein V6C78_15415 [Crinalium sp.]